MPPCDENQWNVDILTKISLIIDVWPKLKPRIPIHFTANRHLNVYILTNWGLYFGAEGVERWKVKTTEYN